MAIRLASNDSCVGKKLWAQFWAAHQVNAIFNFFIATSLPRNNEKLICNLCNVKTLQQFRVIRDHLNSKCLTLIIVFGIQFDKIRQIRIRSTPIFLIFIRHQYAVFFSKIEQEPCLVVKLAMRSNVKNNYCCQAFWVRGSRTLETAVTVKSRSTLGFSYYKLRYIT